jgi:hypothetical protein
VGAEKLINKPARIAATKNAKTTTVRFIVSWGGKNQNGFVISSQSSVPTMNYDNLSLAELKKHAQGRRIKLYYTKSIRELRWLLSQPDIPMQYKLEKFTIKELREQAKAKNIRGFWNLKRGDLLNILYPSAAEQHDQNNQNPQEHHSPQSNDCDKVGM